MIKKGVFNSMAKRNQTESYKKAMIDYENMEITEYEKDSINTYSIHTILKRWNGVEGITLTIKTDEEIQPDKEG